MLRSTFVFRLAAAFLLLLGIFTTLAPALTDVDLFYPRRLDSAFVAESAGAGFPADSALPLTPSSLHLDYSPMHIVTQDSLTLRGWLIPGQPDLPLLLIVHDLNQGKIEYLDLLHQLHERGIGTGIVDLRAHGSSDGHEFSPGIPSVSDVGVLADSLIARGGFEGLFLMGAGTGAFIVTRAAAVQDRYSGLILENARTSYAVFLDDYADRKWGRLAFLFRPAFRSRAMAVLGADADSFDVARLMTRLTLPVLFIAGTAENFPAASESALLKDSSASRQKELFLIRDSYPGTAAPGNEAFADRISGFMIRSMPRMKKKGRNKRLVYE
jgi:pimeloyl-ACP methyl ester carboxylesterase